MWLLKDADGEVTYILTNKALNVGRTSGDLILRGQSISRTHASISIEPISQIQANKLISKCIVKDTGSKYGSYILNNGDATMITKEGTYLNNLDKIRFGLQKHIFTVHYVPIITATSAIDDDVKPELTDIMNYIDGIITTNNILSSTHLTVSKGFLTEKVACALAACIPIVTIKYWRDVLSAVKGNKQLPNPSEYTQLISEGMIQKEMALLSVNPGRSKLFKNLLFVFLTSLQYNKLSRMIKAAGGKCLLYEKKPLHGKDLSAVNVIILQPPDDSSQTEDSYDATYASIRAVLQKSKRRMIPETDVTLAILYCSTKIYCNPKFDFSNLLISSKKESSQANAKIIEADSQDNFALQKDLNIISSNEPMTPHSSKKHIDYIPETNTSINNSETIPQTEVQVVASKTASKNKVDEDNQNINDIKIIENSQSGKERNVQINKFTKKNIPTSQAHTNRSNVVIPETGDHSGIIEDIIFLDDDDDDNNSKSKKHEASKNIESRQSGSMSLSTKQKRERSESIIDSIVESKKQRSAVEQKTLKNLYSLKRNQKTPEKDTTLSPNRFSCNVETNQHLSDDRSHSVTKLMKPDKTTLVLSPVIKQDPVINLDDDVKVLNIDSSSIKVKTEDVSSETKNISPGRSLTRIKLDRSGDGFYRTVQHWSQGNLINIVPLLRQIPSTLKPKGLRKKRIPKQNTNERHVCLQPDIMSNNKKPVT